MTAGSSNGTANASYTEFLLLPFPGLRESRDLLAIPFFSLFFIIVSANSVLIYTVRVEASLPSPMYLLIALLFAVNISGTLVIFPQMLLGLLSHVHISLMGCLGQMFFLYLSTALDCNVLLMMALDRYVAICYPLRYTEIMTTRLLVLLTLGSLLCTLSVVSPVVILASRVRFCRSNVIAHFACEHMALMRLSCSDISINKMVGITLRCVYNIISLSLLLASYGKIIHTALKISSGSVRHKTFHTCGTHLIVIFTCYSSRLSSSIVFRLAKSASADIHNLISAIYLLVPWTVYPIVYGMRTKEIKENCLKLFRKKFSTF